MTGYEDLINRLRSDSDLPYSLIPLPWPAIMDMREAAAVIEEISQEYESMAAALLEADELIRKLQSERDDPVKKEREPGTWKLAFTEDENIYECSKCGQYWLLNDGDPYENQFYYCPKCGTRMIGGDDDA